MNWMLDVHGSHCVRAKKAYHLFYMILVCCYFWFVGSDIVSLGAILRCTDTKLLIFHSEVENGKSIYPFIYVSFLRLPSTYWEFINHLGVSHLAIQSKIKCLTPQL